MIFIKANPVKKRFTDEQIVRILRAAESKELESEYAKLKRLVAEQLLVIDGLNEISRNK